MRKKQKYMPYFFDYKYERKTYKYIGRDYGDSITANEGWIKNFAKWYRKRVYNRKESKYKICHTYTEWKEHISKVQFYNDCERENAIKYVENKRRIAELALDIVKILIIPIYIALFSIVFSITNKQAPWWIIIFILCFLAVSIYLIVKSKKEVFFYNDYISCLGNGGSDLINHQK